MAVRVFPAEALRWVRGGLRLFPDLQLLRADECHLLFHLGDDVAAEGCYDRLGKNFPAASWWRGEVYFYRGQWEQGIAYLEGLEGERGPERLPYVLIWRYMDVGEFDRALALSREHREHMYLEEPYQLKDHEMHAGTEVATLLLKTGDAEGADAYFDQILEITGRRSRLGRLGFGWRDIGVQVLRGDQQAAVAALREAVDAGPRRDWWCLNLPYMVEPMKDVPEWHALWAELRADINRQRAWYEAHKDDPLP